MVQDDGAGDEVTYSTAHLISELKELANIEITN